MVDVWWTYGGRMVDVWWTHGGLGRLEAWYFRSSSNLKVGAIRDRH